MNSPPPVPKKTKTKYPKIFQCTGYGDCKMTFTRSEHLARHIRKHTGERPFRCHCGKTFSRLDNLRQHIQTVHANDHHILHAPLPPPPMPQGDLQAMGQGQMGQMGQVPMPPQMGQQQQQQQQMHPQHMAPGPAGHVPSPMMSHHGAPHPHAAYPQMYDYQYPPGQQQQQPPPPPQQLLHHYSSEESLPSSVNSSQTSLQTAYSPQVGNMQRNRRPTPISTEQQQQQQQQQQGPPSPTYPTTPTQYSTHSNHSSIAGISISDMPPVMSGQRPPSLGGDGDAASVFSSPYQSRGHHVRASVSSTNSLTSAYNYPVHSSNLTTPVSTHSNQPGNTNSWLSSVLCSGQDGSASNRHSSASSTSAFSNSPQPDDNRPRTWGPSTNTNSVAGSASPHQQYRGSGMLTGDPGFDSQSGRQSLSSLVINESMDESDDDMSGSGGSSGTGAPLPPNKDKPLPPFSSLFNGPNSANRPQISVNKSYTKNLILPRPDSYPPKPPAAQAGGPAEFGDFSSSHVLPMADMRPVVGQGQQPQGKKDKPLPPLPVEADDVEMSDAPQRGGMDYLLEAASLSSRA
ncbi:C2H2 finger domain transcription factor dvrA [Yarrowia sp. C11]|nr:C2H2 finger domain transcription factor dvrA [Yarrowia sp. E02]KAG5372421.1 C2H2 finger domain transcription factor dvrA [Yarrowia sp. C11]